MREVVATLAVKRITRLVTKDKIAEPLREYVAETDTTPNKSVTYLVNCPMCVSVWASLLVWISYMLFPKASLLLMRILASSEAVALYTEYEAQRDALVENYGPPL